MVNPFELYRHIRQKTRSEFNTCLSQCCFTNPLQPQIFFVQIFNPHPRLPPTSVVSLASTMSSNAVPLKLVPPGCSGYPRTEASSDMILRSSHAASHLSRNCTANGVLRSKMKPVAILAQRNMARLGMGQLAGEKVIQLFRGGSRSTVCIGVILFHVNPWQFHPLMHD